jgi:hypothetical protein
MGVGKMPSLLGGATYSLSAAEFGRQQMALVRAGRKKLRTEAAVAAHHAAELYRRSGFLDIAKTIENAVARARTHERAEEAELAARSLLASAGARKLRGRPKTSTNLDHTAAAEQICSCLSPKHSLSQALETVARQDPWVGRKISTDTLRRYWKACARSQGLTPEQLERKCGGDPWRSRRTRGKKSG